MSEAIREVPWVNDMIKEINKKPVVDRRTPSKHVKATLVYRLQGLFMRIKELSASGEIDRMCLDGLNKLSLIVNKEGLQDELDVIKERMIDPMG